MLADKLDPEPAGEIPHFLTVGALFSSVTPGPGSSFQGSNLLSLAGTKKDLVELLPSFIVREFEHATR